MENKKLTGTKEELEREIKELGEKVKDAEESPHSNYAKYSRLHRIAHQKADNLMIQKWYEKGLYIPSRDGSVGDLTHDPREKLRVDKLYYTALGEIKQTKSKIKRLTDQARELRW